MTEIQTAEEFARSIDDAHWKVSAPLITARDAAVRADERGKVIRQVLGMLEKNPVDSLFKVWLTQYAKESGEVVAQNENYKLVAPTPPFCRETAKQVLREVFALVCDCTTGTEVRRNLVLTIASEFNLTLADIEPKPKYTKEMIEVAEGLHPEQRFVRCGDFHVVCKFGEQAFRWVPWESNLAGTEFPPCVAPLIAAHLRATNNLPKEQ